MPWSVSLKWSWRIDRTWKRYVSTVSIFWRETTTKNCLMKSLMSSRMHYVNLKDVTQIWFTISRASLPVSVAASKKSSKRHLRYLKWRLFCSLRMQGIRQSKAISAAWKVNTSKLTRPIRELPSMMKHTCSPYMEWSTAESSRSSMMMLHSNLNSYLRLASLRVRAQTTLSWKHSSSGAWRETKWMQSDFLTRLSTYISSRPRLPQPTLISTSSWMPTFWWSWHKSTSFIAEWNPR